MWAAVICALVYGAANTVIDFSWSVCSLVLVGGTWAASLAAELTSIPATVINAVFTVAGTAVLYVPVRSAWQRLGR